ncbi:hypothetical protein [Janibacter sp. LM]|uniref:hypothetical protein n=1 Tax=Janibacter sp. LM TaxID=3144845 RepID=UPI0031F69D29
MTEPHSRPFADFIREQNRGRTHDELSDGLRDLVSRVEDTGKKGTITLTVTVEPLKGNESCLQVSDEIKLKLPEHDRGSSIFFRGRDGNLQRDDPNQVTFDFLREVTPPPGVDPATGEVRDTGTGA